MATLGGLFQDTANAIRQKGGSIDALRPIIFPQKILGIPTEAGEVPEYKKLEYYNRRGEIDTIVLISEKNNEHTIVCRYEKEKIVEVLYNGKKMDIVYSPSNELLKLNDTEIELVDIPLEREKLLRITTKMAKVINASIKISPQTAMKMSMKGRKIFIQRNTSQENLLEVVSNEVDLSKCLFGWTSERRQQVARTSNYNSDGEANEPYTDFGTHKTVISFPGTKENIVNIKYSFAYNDGVKIFKGDYEDLTFESTNYLKYYFGKRAAGDIGEDSFVVEDDTITFIFNGTGNASGHKGYYATVENFFPEIVNNDQSYNIEGLENTAQLCCIVFGREPDYYDAVMTDIVKIGEISNEYDVNE